MTRKILLLTSFILSTLLSFSQTNYHRKHYLVFYDISSPSKSVESKEKRVQQVLQDLFNNKNPFDRTNIKDENVIDKIPFIERFSIDNDNFDPELDEITFFYFNINRDKKNEIEKKIENGSPEDIYEFFLERFIWKQLKSWGEYSEGGSTVSNYLIRYLWSQGLRAKWGNGTSFSSLVYPLGLDMVPDSYAEDYYFITITDYVTGTETDNKEDLDNLIRLMDEDPKFYGPVKEKRERLTARLDKDEIFKISFDGTYDGKDNDIFLTLSQIRPNLSSDNTSNLSVSGTHELKQLHFGQPEYTLKNHSIETNHNSRLKINKVVVNLIAKSDLGSDTLAQVHLREMEAENVGGNYRYTFPDAELMLSGTLSVEDLSLYNNFQLAYTFFGQYQPDKGTILKVISNPFPIALAKGSFYFAEDPSSRTLYHQIGIASLLLILLIVYKYLGRPMKITAKISPFSDRIEHIQVDDGFKKKYSDYLPEDAGGIKRNLRVKGTIAYTSRIGKWSSRLKLSIKADKIPEGLRISLKKQPREEASYLPGETMMLKSNNDFVFYVNVSKEYAEGSYEESKTVSFHVTLELNERRLFGLLKSDLVHHQIPYTFEVGPDLGTTWIAIDPGTTGTTIAMSDGIHNLVIPRKNNNYLITPSVVAFNKEFEMKNPDFPLSGRGSLYRTGEGAEQWMGTDTGTRKGEYFESIKKMLGYSNSQLVSFE
ncbi:MAG: hypothetical protein AAFN93_14135, partial [Bacteroidota bacterium]